MNGRFYAQAMLWRLSEVELDALRRLSNGESVTDLARRRSITETKAAEIRQSIKWKLGVRKDAEAVRICLIADADL